jgi:TRAP-type C4-dicarboxylate transport system permease small subunit
VKHKWFKIGICLFVIGIFGLIYIGAVQSKININNMTAADWQSCQHIDGIGAETISKLESNAPFDRIQDIEKIDGIGTAKTAIIERHFCTYDTCRFEIFIVALSISCALIALGSIIIIGVEARRKCTADNLMEGLIKKG